MNSTNNKTAIEEMEIKKGENEIRDLTRFWNDLRWYEREYIIINSIESVKLTSTPIIRSAVIPEDLKRRCGTAIENLNRLKALNDKEKPSKIFLKLFEFRIKLGLMTQEEKNDTGPNLRMCIAAISNLSDKERARLDKYLDLEDIVKQAREHSYSYEEIYEKLFSELLLTSQTKFIVFSKYIGKHVHFQ